MKSRPTKFVLVQLAHKGLQRQSDNAAFRILGGFENHHAATRHLKKMAKKDVVNPACTFLLPTHDWNVIPSTPARTQEYLSTKTTALTHANAERHRTQKEEFKKMVQHRKDNNVETEYVPALDLQETDAAFEGDSDDDDEEIDARGVRVNQNYACVSILHDTDEEAAEPAFVVWGVFDQQDRAKEYMTTTISDATASVNTYLVDMYKWVFPHVLLDKKTMLRIPAAYRDEKLNALMQPQRDDIKALVESANEAADAPGVEISELGAVETKSG